MFGTAAQKDGIMGIIVPRTPFLFCDLSEDQTEQFGRKTESKPSKETNTDPQQNIHPRDGHPSPPQLNVENTSPFNGSPTRH